MDLSEPTLILLAFGAGLSVLLLAKLVWGILTHVVHIAIFAGLIAFLNYQGVIRLAELRESTAAHVATESAALLRFGFTHAQELISEYDFKIEISRKKPTTPEMFEKASLGEKLAKLPKG